MAQDIFNKIANGAIWMLLFKSADRGLALISTLILVRLLDPTDFGVVAMAMSVIAILGLFTAFGFDTAIIRQQNATDDHLNTAWTFDVVFGTGMALAMVLCAPLVADFYRQPEVEQVLYVLALVPLIGGFENIGIVLFRKELEFRREFRFQVAKKFASFSITVPLAFWLKSYWALVLGTLGGTIAALILSFTMHRYRPRFAITEWRDLFGFSKWLLFNNLTRFIIDRASVIVVGRLTNARSLGLYQVSYEVANLPTTEFGAPINRALMPGYAAMQADHLGLLDLYRRSISLVSLVAVPAAAGIYATAHLVVPVLLGQKWLDGVPLVQVFGINGALAVLQASLWSLLVGTDHPRAAFTANAIYAVLLLVLLIGLTQQFGLIGAAFACLITTVVTTPVYLALVKRHLTIPMRQFALCLYRPTLAALAMVVALHELLPPVAPIPSGPSALAWLVTGIISGAAIYSATIAVLWLVAGRPDGAEQAIVDRALKEFRDRVRRPGA